MAATTLHMASKLITSTPLNYQNLPPSSQIIVPLVYNHQYNSVNNIQSTRTTSRRRISPVCNAVKAEEFVEHKTTPASSKLVLVIGASGGVGQLIVASLLSRNIKSRLLVRDPEKATTLFGEQDGDKLQVYKGDTRNPEDLDPLIFEEQQPFHRGGGMVTIPLKE